MYIFWARQLCGHSAPRQIIKVKRNLLIPGLEIWENLLKGMNGDILVRDRDFIFHNQTNAFFFI
jgi:hypothetical protein